MSAQTMLQNWHTADEQGVLRSQHEKSHARAFSGSHAGAFSLSARVARIVHPIDHQQPSVCKDIEIHALSTCT